MICPILKYQSKAQLMNPSFIGGQAIDRRQDRGVLAHQRPDRRPHRDAHRPRRTGKEKTH